MRYDAENLVRKWEKAVPEIEGRDYSTAARLLIEIIGDLDYGIARTPLTDTTNRIKLT
jgi:hypothetical protein